MDEAVSRLFINRGQSHFKGFQRVYCLQGGAKGPADNLVGVGVRYQRKIADAFLSFYVRYVADPYLIRSMWNHIFDEVGILPVMMVRVCGLIAPPAPDIDHQAILPEDLDERVSPRHTAGLLKQRADNDVQLHTAKAWIILAVLLRFLNNQRLDSVLCKVVLLVLVE